MHTDINTIDDIRILVDSFYKSAEKDNLLGPIFSRIDARQQRETLYAYWNDVLLDRSANRQAAFPDHIGEMFSPRHFIRWTTLFLSTIDLLYAGPTAEKAKVMVIRKCEEFQSDLEMAYF